MKFSAAAVVAAAAAVSGEAVFTVSDFTAACVQHSALCNYSFGLLQPGTMQTEPQVCTAQLPGAGLGVLPPVAEGTCQETSRTWSVVRNEDGSITLTATQQVTPSSFQSGSHTIPADQIEVQQSGASIAEVYTGPKDFDLEPVAA